MAPELPDPPKKRRGRPAKVVLPPLPPIELEPPEPAIPVAMVDESTYFPDPMDIDNDGSLTDADREQLRAVLAEFASREMEALHLFIPMDEQERFFSSNADERVASAATVGQDDGDLHRDCACRHRARSRTTSTPKEDGRCILVGRDQTQCAKVFYQKLFVPGAFQIIRDLETGKWRVFKPNDPADMDREDEARKAPPLISPASMISRGLHGRTKRSNSPRRSSSRTGGSCSSSRRSASRPRAGTWTSWRSMKKLNIRCGIPRCRPVCSIAGRRTARRARSSRASSSGRRPPGRDRATLPVVPPGRGGGGDAGQDDRSVPVRHARQRIRQPAQQGFIHQEVCRRRAGVSGPRARALRPLGDAGLRRIHAARRARLRLVPHPARLDAVREPRSGPAGLRHPVRGLPPDRPPGSRQGVSSTTSCTSSGRTPRSSRKPSRPSSAISTSTSGTSTRAAGTSRRSARASRPRSSTAAASSSTGLQEGRDPRRQVLGVHLEHGERAGMTSRPGSRPFASACTWTKRAGAKWVVFRDKLKNFLVGGGNLQLPQAPERACHRRSD
jgi:hypothetical protein